MDDELASMLPMIAAGYYVYIFVVMAFFFQEETTLNKMKPLYFLLFSYRTQFYCICSYC